MKNNARLLIGLISLFSFSLSFSACSDDDEAEESRQEAALAEAKMARDKALANTPEFYALTDQNQLVKYTTLPTLKEASNVTLSGLQTGEVILAIDFRPATGQLYGVSNQSRLYVLNQITGKVTAVGTTPFSPPISGNLIGFDFNPTVDRIRLVTETGQNLRLHPETGAVAATDGSLNPGTPAVMAAAYTNSTAGASTTALYDIDTKTDMLYMQNPPNTGVLVEVGRLNAQATREGGFDISPDNSVAIAALYGKGSTGIGQEEEVMSDRFRFYTIDLQTGRATSIDWTERTVIGLAIPAKPVAYGVDADNNLLLFNPLDGGNLVSKAITGLLPGERVLGLDMRPATSQLYALGSTSRIYSVNLGTGAFMAIGGPFLPALSGESFGFDFNPTVDRIRVVSNTGQNLRLHPDTGLAAAVDGNLNPGTPAVDASAYTNNFAGATATALYSLDFQADALYMQNPPNNGTQVLVGNLGVGIGAGNGFDIGGTSGRAAALLQIGTQTSVYIINLENGQSTKATDLTRRPMSFALGLGF